MQSDQGINALIEAGIEVYPQIWTVEFGLRNGTSHQYTLLAADKNRLHEQLFDWDSHHEDKSWPVFFVFDSELFNVCVNLRQVTYSRFLWDMSTSSFGVDDDAPRNMIDAAPMIQVWRTSQKEPHAFDSESEDSLLPDDPEYDDNDMGQLRSMLWHLDCGGSSGDSFVNFVDGDGEEILLRRNDIAMVAIPQWMLNSEFIESDSNERESSDIPDAMNEPIQ